MFTNYKTVMIFDDAPKPFPVLVDEVFVVLDNFEYATPFAFSCISSEQRNQSLASLAKDMDVKSVFWRLKTNTVHYKEEDGVILTFNDTSLVPPFVYPPKLVLDDNGVVRGLIMHVKYVADLLVPQDASASNVVVHNKSNKTIPTSLAHHLTRDQRIALLLGASDSVQFDLATLNFSAKI